MIIRPKPRAERKPAPRPDIDAAAAAIIAGDPAKYSPASLMGQYASIVLARIQKAKEKETEVEDQE